MTQPVRVVVRPTKVQVITNRQSTFFISRAYHFNLPASASSYAVTFTTAMPNTNYTVVMAIHNMTDASPQFLIPIMTSRSLTGFTATWNSETDSANYVLSVILSEYNWP